MSNLTKKLQKLQTENMLTKYVINYLLQQGSSNEIESHIKDILQYGCESGIVSELIYYKDTHDFFDKYYSEIDEIRFQYEEETGTNLTIKGDLKNFLSWFSFEQTILNIATDLGIY